MTERSQSHAADAMVGPRGKPTDHGADAAHDDAHSTSEALGPLDARAWGAAGLGIVLGLAVAVAFLASIGFNIGGL